MIILDTNVLWEALKPLPSDVVLNWMSVQEPSDVFTTTITQAEIMCGIELLPMGKRRTRLAAAVEKVFAEDFQGRILAFDEDVARSCANILATRIQAGRPIPRFDVVIAAVARPEAPPWPLETPPISRIAEYRSSIQGPPDRIKPGRTLVSP